MQNLTPTLHKLPLELAALHQDWRGWSLALDGRLYFDGWKRGYEPGELAGMRYHAALIKAQERQIATLRAELVRRVNECEEAEKRAAYYRGQLLTECKFGYLIGLLDARPSV